MRYWLNAGFLETHQLATVAREAERLGFEGITMPDHLFLPERLESLYPYSDDGSITWPEEAPWPDCWVAIAAMAQVTERLRFTTGVYVAPLRDVFSLAKSIGTAAGFGPGRVTCGLGAGWMREEFESVGQDFATRGRRFDEMLDVLPLLWSGEVVEYHGEQIDFDRLRMRPAAGRVPILVGGNTGPALKRAARCDGWIGAYSNLPELEKLLDRLRELREAHAEPAGSDAFEILVTATPGIARLSDELDALGVNGVILPIITLTPSTETLDIVAGLERFAARRMQ